MSDKVALSPGLTLNTAIDGDKGNPWIVLSNSLGANLSMWDPQIDVLTTKYRVLRYDTRGHGGSDVPEGPYDFAGLVADVIALMDAHDIESAAFMGLSMGGMTGLGLALDHPDRVSRVVCADGRADAPEPFRAMWDQRMAAVGEHGLAGIVDGTLATWFTEAWREANPDKLAEVRSMVLGNDPAGYTACCQALKRLDYLRRLGDVTIPVLYVGGSEDKGAAPEVMRAMAAATPGGKFHEVPDAAHVANINQPKAFNDAVAGFLDL
ncbi:MAG: 3-oxoadipate enol-lactonase [Paracoccaceae bacterium]|nr:3-oxoadipate enol-lactonase [Paracoccaceae bacterium]